jgi:hypothetical protein
MRRKVQAMASEAHEFDALSAIAANAACQLAACQHTGASAACIEATQPEIRASQCCEREQQALAAQAAALDALEACGSIERRLPGPASKGFVTAGNPVFRPFLTCPSGPHSQSAAAQREWPAATRAACGPHI